MNATIYKWNLQTLRIFSLGKSGKVFFQAPLNVLLLHHLAVSIRPVKYYNSVVFNFSN